MDHQALLRAVETSDCKVFIEWYKRVETENISAVRESVDRLSNKDLCGIWTVFTKWVAHATNSLKENPNLPENDSIMTTLLFMSTMATYTIHNMSNNEPQGLQPSVKAMNGSLKFVNCKKAATSICKMSEHYWKVHPELETFLSINTIQWFLTQAIHPKATLVSVKQLWDMKQSIAKLNALILESSGLLTLFLSAISNSKFIGSNEGQKCIACLFNFNTVIVQVLQKTVKKFIPLATVNDCESLGEIYFKAWRMATEERRADIEFAIQDLMYHAVVACRKPLGVIEGGVNKVPMNKLLFHLLHSIHRQRKQRTVAVLIHILYKPILWRYLEASNGLVRGNALCLFFDAFPFESGEGFEEDEAVRTKQWAIMLGALMDPVPLVRTIAIQGTCRILSQYWEIVPLNIIQDFITCLMRKLLYDSSSADVRAHVVKGLVMMLESRQTHSLLEKMIPLTNKVLHDPNEKVRSEYVFLLTHVQKLRVSKLWEVIDVNQLVGRLAMETSKNVCIRLATLLAPFYCPKSTPEIVFQRCLRLIIDNRLASRKFYQYIDTCVGIEQIAQLILIIWKFLRNHIHKQLQRNKSSQQREETANQRRPCGAKRSRQGEGAESIPNTTENEDKENQDGSTDSEETGNEEFSECSIIGLIDVVCILLSVNKTKFKAPPNVVFWENIKSRFSKTCSLFFRYFKNSEGLRPLICLYGLMSSTSSTLLLSFVKSQLKSLTDEATCKEFSYLVDVMCTWGRGEDLLDLITDHLQGNLMNFIAEKSPLSDTRKGKATRKKRVSFETPKDSKPLLGLRWMAYILQHPYNKKIILRKNLEQIGKLCETLKAVLLIAENNPNRLTNRESFLFGAASLYVKMVLVLACSYKREKSDLKYMESQEKIVGILSWTKRLMENEDLNPILGDLISSAVSSISNLVMIHSMTWEVFRQFLDVVLQVVTKYPSSKSLTLAMNCAYHSLVFVWSERSIGNECDVECESRINLIINCVLECASLVTASGSSTRFCLDEDDWSLVRDIVKKILEECHRHRPEKHESIREIVRKMVDTIRSDMMQPGQGDGKKKADDASCQHQLSKAIIAAFRTQNSLAKMILDEFFEVFQSNENETTLVDCVAIARLLESLGQNKGRIAPGTLANAILSFEDCWLTVGEIEKSANSDRVAYVSATITELKKAFSV